MKSNKTKKNNDSLSRISQAVQSALGRRSWTSIALSGLVCATPSFVAAQQVDAAEPDASGIEIIEITSRKRRESIQDVPTSVQALSQTRLEELGITDFDDYAMMFPSLSFESTGPGLSQIYMRGAADGGDGNASGSQPSVAMYLDEQPVTAIGRNLDIHIYDIERIEALTGPQSTLFGASSQSGTLRIITNKPEADYFEAGVSADVATTKSGDISHTLEGFVNIPLGDETALRLVGWNKHEGGYIDNIPGTHTSGLFVNGGNSVLVTNDNADYVEENFNDLDNSGGRASLKTNVNDDWEVILGALYQKQDTNGVWFHDPENPNGEIGDLEVQRFNPESMKDEFVQTSLTVTGDLGFADLIYAGSFLDRDVEYYSDYSDYTDYYSTSWIQYYGCEYYGTATADCTSMMIAYNDDNKYKRDTHELRLQSTADGKFQYVVGLYIEDSSHDYRQEWVMEGMAKGPDFEQFGEPNLWYLTDQFREDNQQAIFGELTYDITENLDITIGGRYFDNESKLSGVSGYGAVYPGFPIIEVDTSVEDSGSIFKANVSYDLDDNKLIYVTWSEGYRPGGINRDETDVVNRVYKADFVENYEFGWKTLTFDQRLKWNGAVYYMDWTDMQLTRYDSSYGSPVGLTINVAESNILGIETDVTYLMTPDFEISASASYNKGELSEDLTVGTNISPKGTELPSVPKFKANLAGRYNFEVSGLEAHFQFVLSYVGDRKDDLFKFTGGDTSTDVRSTLDSYQNVNLSAGVRGDQWTADIYVDNLTDERHQISGGGASWDSTITVNRPRTIGVSVSYLFE
jgi:outer membrane receptor protein involved in Fe transport